MTSKTFIKIDSLLDLDLRVFLDWDEFHKYTEKWQATHYKKDDVSGLFASRGKKCAIYLEDEDDVGIVSHEAFHLISHVLQLYGMTNMEEVNAVLLGLIVNKISKGLTTCSEKKITKEQPMNST